MSYYKVTSYRPASGGLEIPIEMTDGRSIYRGAYSVGAATFIEKFPIEESWRITDAAWISTVGSDNTWVVSSGGLLYEFTHNGTTGAVSGLGVEHSCNSISSIAASSDAIYYSTGRTLGKISYSGGSYTADWEAKFDHTGGAIGFYPYIAHAPFGEDTGGRLFLSNGVSFARIANVGSLTGQSISSVDLLSSQSANDGFAGFQPVSYSNLAGAGPGNAIIGSVGNGRGAFMTIDIDNGNRTSRIKPTISIGSGE